MSAKENDMARYVDADKLKKSFDLYFGGVSHAVIANQIIESEPTADVAEVKHGEWEYPFSKDIAKCTNCDFCVQDKINNVGYMYNYCPNCGAKMDGKLQKEVK